MRIFCSECKAIVEAEHFSGTLYADAKGGWHRRQIMTEAKEYSIRAGETVEVVAEPPEVIEEIEAPEEMATFAGVSPEELSDIINTLGLGKEEESCTTFPAIEPTV